MVIFVLLVCAVFAWEGGHAIAQEDSDDAGKTVTAGAEYEAGGMHSFIAGKHWRDLWTTPFQASYLNLDTFAGGLTPLKKGGGMQTQSLKFSGADGRVYKFRSLNKNPARGLLPDLQESIVADILQDQVSVIHPLSAVVVAPMLNAIGIFNAEPIVCVLPDSPRLGIFREEFAGLLGTIEEHPNEGPDGEPGFAGADKVIGGFKVLERLEEDNDNRVDDVEFLKARLMDIFIGDRDRHADQWRWAGFKSETKHGKQWLWKPIPRDRDFAFPLYDGLVPQLTTLLIISHVHFGENMPAVFDITYSGRHLDRRFLGGISKTRWDSVARFMSARLSDSLIEASVRRMPPEWLTVEGGHLIGKLKSRRDQLMATSDEYYGLINRFVDIYGSDKREFAEITRLDDQRLHVALFRRKKNSYEKKGPALVEKTFHIDTTVELRVHLLGGDDYAIVRGSVDENIRLVVDGGAGADVLVDSSHVDGCLLYVTPISDAEDLTKFYDDDPDTEIIHGSGTDVFILNPDPPLDEVDRWEPFVENRDREWGFAPWLNYNSDDGLTIGGGPELFRYDVFAKPYDFSMILQGAYATGTEGYDIIYEARFTRFIPGAVLHLFAETTELEINRYYGNGNETELVQSLADQRFYQVAQNLTKLEPKLWFDVADEFKLSAGAFYQFSSIDSINNTLVLEEKPYGIGTIRTLGLSAGFKIDTRDEPDAAFEGFYLKSEGRYYSGLLNTRQDFAKVSVDARTYLTSDFITKSTLALRLQGEKTWGRHPFFEAAIIGGKSSLRGFGRDRFQGDAALTLQSDLRVHVARMALFMPFHFGLLGFGDTGRVFESGQDSKRWHSSFGGGIWMSFLNRRFNLSFAVGRSPERTKFYASTKMMF